MKRFQCLSDPGTSVFKGVFHLVRWKRNPTVQNETMSSSKKKELCTDVF